MPSLSEVASYCRFECMQGQCHGSITISHRYFYRRGVYVEQDSVAGQDMIYDHYMVIGSCFGAAYQSFIRLAKESLPRCAGSSCSSWIAACLGFLLIINSKLNNVENKIHPYTSQPLCCQQNLYLQHWLSMTLTYDFFT